MVADFLAPTKAQFAEEISKQRVRIHMQLAECKAGACSALANLKANSALMVASVLEAGLANWLRTHRP